jgi:hypothetical protein
VVVTKRAPPIFRQRAETEGGRVGFDLSLERLHLFGEFFATLRLGAEAGTLHAVRDELLQRLVRLGPRLDQVGA